ncbi:hypothetical protein AB8Q18_11370 [Neisseriaceae bacterium CLB008]
MISNQDLLDNVHNGRVFDRKTLKAFLASDNKQIQEASIDLTINRIYSFRNDNGVTYHRMKPGETLIIEVREVMKLDCSIAGIVFPPNSLSKFGILMTNPGHIDPGFEGKITIYLVNMGCCEHVFNEGDKVATLLLFNTTKKCNEYSNKIIDYEVPVNKKQLEQIGTDFAGLKERIPKLIRNYLAKQMGVIIVLIGFFLTLVSVVIPVILVKYDKFYDMHVHELEEVNKLRNTVEEYKKQIGELRRSSELKAHIEVSKEVKTKKNME